jgi:hypothetical protein
MFAVLMTLVAAGKNLPDGANMQRMLLALGAGVPLILLALWGRYRSGRERPSISTEWRVGLAVAGVLLLIAAAVGW